MVFVEIDGEPCGVIAVSDKVKDSAADAVAALHARGLRTVLLTGDNPASAAAVAARVGIDEVIADVLPEGKVDLIGQLRDHGHVVAMVGDGINDGPALACADLGMAIGRGTDVAIGAADIILVREDLAVIPLALDLAAATMRKITVNMIWAFGYNIAAIPIAAAGLLNPLIAGAAMAFSSFFVVSNSLRLNNFGLSRARRRLGTWLGGCDMARKAGDRYECTECGSILRYEKDCPCDSDTEHAEVCCDKPMTKVSA